MSKGGSDVSEREADAANLTEADFASNQQAVVIPLFCGEAKFALQWLCYPFNQLVKDAPMKRPGKK